MKRGELRRVVVATVALVLAPTTALRSTLAGLLDEYVPAATTQLGL